MLCHILFLLFNMLPQIQNLAQHMSSLRDRIAASFTYFTIIKVNDIEISIQFFSVLSYGICNV